MSSTASTGWFRGHKSDFKRADLEIKAKLAAIKFSSFIIRDGEKITVENMATAYDLTKSAEACHFEEQATIPRMDPALGEEHNAEGHRMFDIRIKRHDAEEKLRTERNKSKKEATDKAIEIIRGVFHVTELENVNGWIEQQDYKFTVFTLYQFFATHYNEQDIALAAEEKEYRLRKPMDKEHLRIQDWRDQIQNEWRTQNNCLGEALYTAVKKEEFAKFLYFLMRTGSAQGRPEYNGKPIYLLPRYHSSYMAMMTEPTIKTKKTFVEKVDFLMMGLELQDVKDDKATVKQHQKGKNLSAVESEVMGLEHASNKQKLAALNAIKTFAAAEDGGDAHDTGPAAGRGRGGRGHARGGTGRGRGGRSTPRNRSHDADHDAEDPQDSNEVEDEDTQAYNEDCLCDKRIGPCICWADWSGTRPLSKNNYPPSPGRLPKKVKEACEKELQRKKVAQRRHVDKEILNRMMN